MTAEQTTMPKAYQPSDVETELYERWSAADVFAPDGAGSRADWSLPPFVIVQPPPNVTGALHLGHAARAATEDLMIRRARMQRRPTLWVPGVDHASIAAQFVLDGIIAREGETRESLGRERYLERMDRFMEETRGIIASQHRRLGASADWSRLRFTMDEGSARAVRVAFQRLHEDGLVYRAEGLIHWCPGCRSSLSDLEVIPTPEKGSLWFVRYHLLDADGSVDSDSGITVATTRPETMLGDTAVAVHPEDDRYRALVGGTVLIPFVDRPVPVITDDVVQREFGTGAVKITPAHDRDDHETGQRHGLPSINVMNDDGTINEVGAEFAGLSREEARRRIIAELDARADLVEVRPHELNIGRCERSGDIVEPRIKTQWFIRTRPLADGAMATVREGRTRILPPRLETEFFRWMENIHDWNVSRQLWWGHRIPAWFCPDGHYTISDREEGPDACETCARPAAELRQEEDIFDTWFSSGLWPMSTLGWPDETEDLRHFYPGSVMETAYDILFFWVARMMMLGERLTGQEPFRTVYLSGLIRDPYGKKMSKTKGNSIDPLGAIEELGADSLRFALIDGATAGADQRLGQAKLEGARNFGNKLWNAARFVLGSRPAEVAADAPLALPRAAELGPAERWILSRCARAIADADEGYEGFRFGDVTRVLYDAIWNEYCDWYLEIAKVQLAPDQPVERRIATWQVLVWVLDRYLRVLHPVMPFITESIWQRLPHAADDAELLIVAEWPDPAATTALVAAGDAAAVEALLDLVRAIRNARAEAGVEPGTWLQAELVLPDAAIADAYASLAEPISRLARIRPVSVAAPGASEGPRTAPGDAISVISGTSEARLSRGSGDLERERARLARELEEARSLLEAARARLANESFVSRAPAAVVDGARRRSAELEELVARLEQRARE